jgi:hypothetical protein
LTRLVLPDNFQPGAHLRVISSFIIAVSVAHFAASAAR